MRSKLRVLCAALVLVACSSDPGKKASSTDDSGSNADGGYDAQSDAPADVAADTPADVAADVPADVAADVPADVAADVPADVAADVPADVAADAPADVAADAPADVAADTPADVAADAPADVAADTPADVMADVLSDVTADVPMDHCASPVIDCTMLPVVPNIAARGPMTTLAAAADASVDAALDVDVIDGPVADAFADVVPFDAPVDATLDGAVDASVPDPAPGITYDWQNGVLQVVFTPNSPPLTVTGGHLQWRDSSTGNCSLDVSLSFTQMSPHGWISTLGKLPQNYVDVCGGTLEVSDACGVVHTLGIVYPSDLSYGGFACAAACGPGQWAGTTNQVCGDCPEPGLTCNDVARGRLEIDGTNNVVNVELAAGAPPASSAKLELAYQDDVTFLCVGTLTIDVTGAGGVLTGALPPLPADFHSFSGCGGTVTYEPEVCGTGPQTFDITVYDSAPSYSVYFNCND